MDSPAAPLSERSDAECGLGGVLEAQARSIMQRGFSGETVRAVLRGAAADEDSALSD